MGFQDLGPKTFNKGINVQITNQQVNKNRRVVEENEWAHPNLQNQQFLTHCSLNPFCSIQIKDILVQELYQTWFKGIDKI